MNHCRWPKGCEQPVGLVEGRVRKLCYHHDKVIDGLIDASLKVRDTLLGPGDILTAAQEEMADVLLKMGASEEAIRRQLFRPAFRGYHQRSDRRPYPATGRPRTTTRGTG